MSDKKAKLKHTLFGAFAGFVATVPMTIAMEYLYRRLPLQERYPLPPSQIISSITNDNVSSDEHRALTFSGHFAYGASIGVVYAWLFHRLPMKSFIKGSLFGLMVWAGSYLGWLPALRILTPASEHPLRRNLLMIVAHFIWGSITAGLMEKFTRKSNR